VRSGGAGRRVEYTNETGHILRHELRGEFEAVRHVGLAAELDRVERLLDQRAIGNDVEIGGDLQTAAAAAEQESDDTTHLLAGRAGRAIAARGVGRGGHDSIEHDLESGEEARGTIVTRHVGAAVNDDNERAVKVGGAIDENEMLGMPNVLARLGAIVVGEGETAGRLIRTAVLARLSALVPLGAERRRCQAASCERIFTLFAMFGAKTRTGGAIDVAAIAANQ
jgi:hypothetical protein